MWMHAPSEMEGVDARARTLARDSRHIVPSGSSDTTFRAADGLLSTSVAGVSVGPAIRLPRPEVGFCRNLFAASPLRADHELDRRTRREPEKNVGRRIVGESDRRRA